MLLTILWSAFGLISIFFAVMSVTLFDDPTTTAKPATMVLFAALVVQPLFWAAGAALPWVYRAKPHAGRWFLLPFADVAVIGVAMAAMGS